MSRRSARARVQDAGLSESLGAVGDLPDINVWLALSIKEHPHHDSAKAYWSDLSFARIWFCRVTKHLTDAYLAAFAVCAGLRLVTFDKDFERFEGLRLLRLST